MIVKKKQTDNHQTAEDASPNITPPALSKTFLIAATVAGVAISIGMAFAHYQRENKRLHQRIHNLASQIHELPAPDTISQLQKQVNALQTQLKRTQEELASKANLKAKQAALYEQEIVTLKKKQKELYALQEEQEKQKNQHLSKLMKRLGVEIRIKQNPKHSGGLFIASSRNKKTEKTSQKAASEYLGSLRTLPIGKPVASEISSPFGYRHDPLNNKNAYHEGIDFCGNLGDPVHATAGGTVVFSGYSRGYGKHIIISHENGFTTLFAHLSKRLVRRGRQVIAGQKIGLIGSTGRSTGAHLHYEVRYNNKPVNPMKYIRLGKAKSSTN